MRRSLKLAAWPLLALLVVTPALTAETPDAVYAGVDGVSLPVVKARSQISPFYPATARLTHAEAVVTVAATVETNGKVSHVEVVSCDQPGMGFEDSVAGAVRHWKFTPSTRDGQAVASTTFLTLHVAEPRPGALGGSSLVRASMVNPPAKSHGVASLGGGRTAAGAAGISTAGVGRSTLTRMERTPCTPGQRCMYDRTKLNWGVGGAGPVSNGNSNAGAGRGGSRR